MFTQAIILALAGAVAAGGANNNGTQTITEIVDIYTTYCPEPTHITMNNKTYTVTEACTFTITDCPCTITHRPTGKPGPQPTVNPGPGPKPTVNPPPPVVGAAGQNSAAYGMAVAGALAAAAVAL